MRLTEVPSHGYARIGDALVRPVQPRVGEVLTIEPDFPLSASPEAQAAAYDLGKLKSAAQVPHTGDVGFGETAYPKPDFDKGWTTRAARLCQRSLARRSSVTSPICCWCSRLVSWTALTSSRALARGNLRLPAKLFRAAEQARTLRIARRVR